MDNLSNPELIALAKAFDLSSGIMKWLKDHKYDLLESIKADQDGSWLVFLSRLLPEDQDEIVYNLRQAMWKDNLDLWTRTDINFDDKLGRRDALERDFADSVRHYFIALIDKETPTP